jgi:hypothetical protein
MKLFVAFFVAFFVLLMAPLGIITTLLETSFIHLMFAHSICNVPVSLRSLYVNMGFIVEVFVIPFICVLGLVGIWLTFYSMQIR